MGGQGSGNWYRNGKKMTAEGSLSLGLADFRGRLYRHSSGIFNWTWAGGTESSVGYFVEWDESGPLVTLLYRFRNKIDVETQIRFQATHPKLGGRRWWFTCPLIFRGVPCNRRVGKIYLPPGARYFGCRLCHNLTYTSSQEAHQGDRIFALIGRECGVDPGVVKRVLSGRGENE